MSLKSTGNPANTLKRTNYSADDFMHISDPSGKKVVIQSDGSILTLGSITATGAISVTGGLAIIPSYGGAPTVDQGIPSIQYGVHTTVAAPAATIATTAIFTATSTQMWRGSVYIAEAVSGAGTASANLLYNNGAAQSIVAGPATLSTGGSFGQAEACFRVPVGSVVSYNVTAGTIATTASYTLDIDLERLF